MEYLGRYISALTNFQTADIQLAYIKYMYMCFLELQDCIKTWNWRNEYGKGNSCQSGPYALAKHARNYSELILPPTAAKNLTASL